MTADRGELRFLAVNGPGSFGPRLSGLLTRTSIGRSPGGDVESQSLDIQGSR